MRPVVLFGLVALDLHGASDDTLSLEGLWLQVDVLRLLEALKARFLTDLCKVVHELNTNSSVFAELLESTLSIQFLPDFLDCLAMWHCDDDDEGLSGITMDEYFGQFIALHVGVLHFFSCNILSLLQLENILLPVDDTQSSGLGAQCPHITSL